MMMDMNIAMSGASGFIGSHLARAFREKGWTVIPLGRDDFEGGDAPLTEKIGGAAVVVNLAGASIAVKWTEEYKKIIYRSRIGTTRKLVEAMKKTGKGPGLFISASAVGIYDTKGTYAEGDEHYAGDFLGSLAVDWEEAALGAQDAGIRTVVFRFGVVLGRGGGVLGKMLTPFRMGLGGVVGDGTQPISWVHMDDLVSAFFVAIENEGFTGIYNLTAPNPATNRGLTEALGHALHVPAVLKIPAFVVRLQFGEGAKVLLEGQRVLPRRLLESGFSFRFTEIEKAVEDVVRERD